MPCDLERERKKRESELKREVSFLPSCFIYEGCWCSRGSDSWMEGREERRAEERSVHRKPLRKLLASSLLALHFPLLHTANSGMRVFSPDDALGLLVQSSFWLAWKSLSELSNWHTSAAISLNVGQLNVGKSHKFFKTMLQEYISKQQ